MNHIHWIKHQRFTVSMGSSLWGDTDISRSIMGRHKDPPLAAMTHNTGRAVQSSLGMHRRTRELGSEDRA